MLNLYSISQSTSIGDVSHLGNILYYFSFNSEISFSLKNILIPLGWCLGSSVRKTGIMKKRL
jgi:hypothetical protein